MTVLGLGSLVPDGDDWISRKFAALEAQIAALRTDRRADYTTVGEGGTFKVDGSFEVTGNAMIGGDTTLDGALTLVGGATLTAAGDVQSSNYDPGNAGWKLDGTTGDIEINDATIRGGIIGDTALSHPVAAVAIASGVTLSQTFTGSFATYITRTITVPAGYSTAIVYAATVATGIGGTATLGTRTRINGVAGPECDAIGSGGTVSVAPYSVKLTGLTGGSTFTVEAQAEDGTGSSLVAGASGIAISGYVLFLA